MSEIKFEEAGTKGQEFIEQRLSNPALVPGVICTNCIQEKMEALHYVLITWYQSLDSQDFMPFATNR